MVGEFLRRGPVAVTAEEQDVYRQEATGDFLEVVLFSGSGGFTWHVVDTSVSASCVVSGGHSETADGAISAAHDEATRFQALRVEHGRCAS